MTTCHLENDPRTDDWQRCAGSVMTLTCSAPLTPAQWEFLQTTDYEFRCVRFHPDNTESSELLLDDDIMVSKMPVRDRSDMKAESACQCQGQVTAVMLGTKAMVEASCRLRHAMTTSYLRTPLARMTLATFGRTAGLSTKCCCADAVQSPALVLSTDTQHACVSTLTAAPHVQHAGCLGGIARGARRCASQVRRQ